MTRRVLLDRELSHAWLDAALGLAVAGASPREAREALHERLRHEQLGEEARIKTVTALTRTWLTPDPTADHLLRWAAAHSANQIDSRPLHIGALLATSAFFTDQAAIVGRILAVQEDVDTPTVRSRMKAIWGPRRSVDVAAQRTIKTMRSLGMLQGCSGSSTSTRASRMTVDARVGGWLAACLLAARGADSIATTEVLSAPELAAFRIPPSLDLIEVGLQRHAEGSGRSVISKG